MLHCVKRKEPCFDLTWIPARNMRETMDGSIRTILYMMTTSVRDTSLQPINRHVFGLLQLKK
jgi:hypothetical protein